MKIRQYCSVCKAEYEMEVVPAGEGDDDPVVWLRCPNCEGYLPKIRDSKAFQRPGGEVSGTTVPAEAETAAEAPADTGNSATATPATPSSSSAAARTAKREAGREAARAAAQAAEREAAADAAAARRRLADADLAQAVPYRPWQSYAVGDVIHHLAWDDYGVVLAKEALPGNRQVVKVHFQQAGTVRLIENDGSRP